MRLREAARSGRVVLLGAAVVFALVASSQAHAVDPPYLAEFPDPARVAKDFAQGDDHLDSLAHQVAALNRLYQIAAEMAGERNYRPGPHEFPNKDEWALRTRIGAVSGPLQREAEATFDPKAKGLNSPRAKWMGRLQEYQSDPELVDQLLQRYFSPQFRSSYTAIAGYMTKVREQSAKETLRGSYTLRGQKMPRWLEMSDAERRSALIWGGGALFVMVLALWIQLRVRPAVPHDRDELHAGFEGMLYDWATGTLTDFTVEADERTWVQQRTESSTSSGGSSGPPIVTHTTDVDEEFSLVYEGGQLDINFSHRSNTFKSLATQYFRGRENHRVTALWFRRKSEAYGRYVTFMDWTRREDFNPWQTKRPIRGSAAALWTILAAVVLGWVVGTSSDFIPFFDGLSRKFLMALSFGAVLVAVEFVVGMIQGRRSARQLTDILNTIGPDDAAPANPKAAPANPR